MEDKLIRGLLFDKSVNVVAVSGKELVTTAQSAHGLSRLCTVTLGRVLLQTVMMTTRLKSETDRVTCILKGGGEAGNIVTTGYPGGIVKGYLEHPTLELPLQDNGTLDVPLAVGWFGDMTVIRDLGLERPYVGTTKIMSGEIADDFANYYMQSEQQPSLIYLGVRMNLEQNSVLSAGGLMLAPLPGCDEEIIDRLTNSVDEFRKLSELLEHDTLENCLKYLFADMDFEVTESSCPEFKCNCSHEHIQDVLMLLKQDELIAMIEEDGGAEVLCSFCNTKYQFSADELREIVAAQKTANGE